MAEWEEYLQPGSRLERLAAARAEPFLSESALPVALVFWSALVPGSRSAMPTGPAYWSVARLVLACLMAQTAVEGQTVVRSGAMA